MALQGYNKITPFRMDGTVNKRKNVARSIHSFPRFSLLIFSSLSFGEFFTWSIVLDAAYCNIYAYGAHLQSLARRTTEATQV